MPEHHKVKVVRIEKTLPHNNANTLGIVRVGEYQCVVKKEYYKMGDLAVYLTPDSVVPVKDPFKFLWADREYPDGQVPERKRRITVRRFRGEWSEGLLLPLSDFPECNWAVAGDDVAEVIGVTHYEEPEPFALGTQGRKLTLLERILKFFGLKPKPYGPREAGGVYDIEGLKHYPRVFTEGEEVLVTEKVHGSNARYVFDGKKFYAGSHKKWWEDHNNIWWQVVDKYPWIEQFCRDWPDYTLRGEVTPTQTGYTYGPDHKSNTEKQFFAFDVQKPDGTYMDKNHLFFSTEMKHYIQQPVPVIYRGPYSAEAMKVLAEGKTTVDGAKHIREGIVISSLEERHVRGAGRAHLKLKSLVFLEKEGK